MIETDIIYNQNCLEGMKSLPDECIDLIVTDPPYKTTPRGSHGGTGGILKDELNMKGKVFVHNNVKISDWVCELYRVLKESGHCYIMCNNTNLNEFLTQIKKAKFNIFKTLIWKKDNCITNQYYMDSHEYIIFCRKGKAIKINNCGTKSVLEVANPKNKKHPTEKPVELMKIFIENSSNEGDIVLDPFFGSGSTLVACIKSNRRYLGYELDPHFFDVACDWLDDVEAEREREREREREQKS